MSSSSAKALNSLSWSLSGLSSLLTSCSSKVLSPFSFWGICPVKRHGVLLFSKYNSTALSIFCYLSLLGSRDSYCHKQWGFHWDRWVSHFDDKAIARQQWNWTFAGAINRARGTCWARACAVVHDRARLTEAPAIITYLNAFSHGN